jgi:glycosyltransferase involved in cell wall biosynthesis
LTTKNGGATRKFKLDGVDIEELAVTKYRGKSAGAYLTSYMSFLAAASFACMRLLSRGELDVVHVHNIPDFLVLAGLVPRFTGRKVVLDVHDSVPETFAAKFAGKGLIRKALFLEERLSARLAHRVICVNHPQRDVLVGRGIPGGKTFISMNVPDPRIFKPSEKIALLNPEDHLSLVYHGTMANRLGVDLLIRSVAQVQHRIPGVRLHLWGHGDDLASFQALARKLEIADRTWFEPKGFPLEELPERLLAMDIGLVGNRRSAATDLMLPVKLLEYVSLGIPTIVPRLKTIEHYFTDDMVAFYEPENVDSLADAILNLHDNVDRRRRQACAASEFLKRHGWELQGKQLVEMYQALLES